MAANTVDGVASGRWIPGLVSGLHFDFEMRLGPMAALILCASCSGSHVPPDPCEPIELRQTLNRPPDQVDLLFVIDNSASMFEEQAALGEELGRLVRVLASGDYDEDGDGAGDGELDDPDFPPVRSLHVGVVTTDMGTAGHTVPTCSSPELGDDGALRDEGDTVTRGCMASYPRFLDYQGFGEADAFAADVACLLRAGIRGCGIEQPLEAALKALSPSAPTAWTAEGYAPPVFHRNTYGHGDTTNDGFARDGSVLAIVPVTDENDCSTSDPALLDPAGPYTSELNFRCTEHQDEALHAVERYVDGYLQLRRNPRHLVFAPIVGIPLGTDTTPRGHTDWSAILEHPDMQERPDAEMPDRLAPACSVRPDRNASPGARLVQVAEALERRGANASVASICNPDYGSALDALIGLLRTATAPSDCLARPVAIEPDSRVRCELDLVLAEGSTCDEVPGASVLIVDGAPVLDAGRPVCRLTQRVPASRALGSAPPSDPGWYYDDFTGEGACLAPDGVPRRVVVNPELIVGAALRLSCHPSALDTSCRDDADCEWAGLPGASCVGSVCEGWTCE